ncbi:MAG TPA: methyl-accepting chemotaxis protein [Bordetella sp.]|uniref:methyl-accepting chemotaxis protein n=1 Tax=Bordetella sp. TaxID=28081 RepID=UPI002ED5410B
MTFKNKIVLLVVTALLAITVVVGLSAYKTRNLILESRHQVLATAVQSAYTIVAGFKAKADSGAMPVEQAQKDAAAALMAARFGGADGKENYFYIWTLDGVCIMHPIVPKWIGQNMAGKIKDGDGNDLIMSLADALKASPDGKTFLEDKFPKPGAKTLSPKLQYVMKVDGWNWMVGSGLYIDDIDSLVMRRVADDLIVLVIALIVVGSLGSIVARSVLRQVGGEPSLAHEAITHVAQGRLDVILPASVPPGSVMGGLRQMIESLRHLVSEVHESVHHISSASGEIAAGNADLSSRTEQQAASLEETAASMEELASTVKQNAENARQANQLAASASEVAVRGGSAVSEVVDTMQAISASSSKISEIVSVIDGIAFQTNILALNAAVEAARAGEQGKGFAVVAGEVRTLAQRSAQAAKEIKQLIEDSVNKVAIGSDQVARAGTTMQEIVASVKRVTDIMGEISAASEEQSGGIDQVNRAVVQMDETTQQNAALVEQAAAAAGSLRDQTQHLTQVVSMFKLGNTQTAVQAAPAAPAIQAAAAAPVPASATSAKARPASPPPALPRPQPRPKATTKLAEATSDWESF